MILTKNSKNWRKKFWPKIKILTHSENLKFAKICLVPYFKPLWVKNIPKLWENSLKSVNLLWNPRKICTMGRFLKKFSIEYFLMPFWNVPKVPTNIPSLVFFWEGHFWKTHPKKAPCQCFSNYVPRKNRKSGKKIVQEKVSCPNFSLLNL